MRVAKTKALISFAATAKLICVFVFAYAKSQFSHDEAQFSIITVNLRVPVSENLINLLRPFFFNHLHTPDILFSRKEYLRNTCFKLVHVYTSF